MGAAHLLEHMVFKGTQNRSAREIALGIEGIGGALDAYTSREHSAVHARVLDEHLPIAVEILTDLVFRPLLLEADLEIERNVVLEEIAMGAIQEFADSIANSSPKSAPVVSFLLKSGLEYGLYELRQEKMNWPFDTAAPLTYETFKFGICVTF